MKFEFDWTEFGPDALKEVQYFEKEVEDNLYGFVPFRVNGEPYIIDIHYYWYGYDDHGFCLEVYKSNDIEQHVKWLDGLKGIRTATSYKRFCRRVEDLVIEYMSKELSDTEVE